MRWRDLVVVAILVGGCGEDGSPGHGGSDLPAHVATWVDQANYRVDVVCSCSASLGGVSEADCRVMQGEIAASAETCVADAFSLAEDGGLDYVECLASRHEVYWSCVEQRYEGCDLAAVQSAGEECIAVADAEAGSIEHCSMMHPGVRDALSACLPGADVSYY